MVGIFEAEVYCKLEMRICQPKFSGDEHHGDNLKRRLKRLMKIESMIKDILPGFYASSFDKASPIWVKTVNWNRCSDIEELFYWFETELIHTKDNFDLLQERAKTFIVEILKLINTLPEHKDLFEFIQFDASVSILRYLTNKKLLTYSYDWLCNSISGEIIDSIKREVEPYRFDVFTTTENEFIKKHFASSFLIWTDNLFYYSRCTGGHNDRCEIYLEKYFAYVELELMKHPSLNEEIVKALVQIAAWCFQHNNDDYKEKNCKMLYKIYKSENDITIKKMIAMYFSCAKTSYSVTTRREWCVIVDKEFTSLLSPHEHLQLFINKYEYRLEEIIDKLDDLFNAIDKYHKYLNTLNSGVIINYELTRIYTLFSNLIHTLLVNGKVSIAHSIIGYYFNIKKDRLINDKVLYIIPNTNSGVAYCTESNVFYTDTNPKINIPKIVALSNDFFSTTNTLDDDLTFRYQAPQRFGVPNANYANAFCESIKEHFKLEKILIIPHHDEIVGLSLVFGTQIPLQPIIAKEYGICIPTVQSLQAPAKRREIRKVLLWQGETLLSETECLGLKNIFSKKGIECLLLRHLESSKEGFLGKYCDESFDLVWVCCHGEFNHMEPHKSYLELGNDISINLEELASQNIQFSERRLLMIDACDGATISLANSPASIGIGITVVNSKQSLISHKWPIDNYSALTSGILLGIFLSQKMSYSDALTNTVNVLCAGKEKVITVIREHCDENGVNERIAASTIDFQNFYTWGSLEYLI